MKIAIVGVGYWGRKVAREYIDLAREGRIKPPIVCDIVDGNLAYFRDKYPEVEITKDYKTLLTRDDVIGVHICTPNHTHYTLCKDFIEAGKHILVEKPMTENYKEALELVELSKKMGVNLSVGHIFRFNNAINFIKRMYEEGVLGELKYLRLQWTSFHQPPKERDVIFDLAPHPLDIINYVFNRWPSKVYCKAKSYIREDKEEVAYIIAEFGDHVTAHIEVSWLYPKKIREVCIMTDCGFYVIDALAQTINYYDGMDWHPIDVIPNNTIKSEIEHFIETIENGNTSINHGENGAENVRVLEILHQSNREGREIDVNF